MTRIDYILGGLYYLSLLFPVVTGVIYIKHQRNEVRLFFILIITAFLAETIALILGLYKINNHLIYQIFILIEFLIYASLLHKWIGSKIIKLAVFPVTILFVIFWLYANIAMKGTNGFSNYPLVMESIIILLFGVYIYLHRISKNRGSIPYDYRLWILLAALFNFGGNIFIYSGMNFIISQALCLWRFHWINNTLVNILYAVSFISLTWKDNAGERNFATLKVAHWETAD